MYKDGDTEEGDSDAKFEDGEIEAAEEEKERQV